MYYVNEDGVDVVGETVSLEGSQIGPEIVRYIKMRIERLISFKNHINFKNNFYTWYDENIAIFVSVVGPVSSSAIANGETRRQFTDLLSVNKKKNGKRKMPISHRY